jgi:ribosomal protein S18 acetylase RimI-like enzyme
MRLLDAGLVEFAGEGLKYLTVRVERDNRNGRRFYERAGFAERRELTQDVEDMCSRWSNTVARSSGVRRSSVN